MKDKNDDFWKNISFLWDNRRMESIFVAIFSE